MAIAHGKHERRGAGGAEGVGLGEGVSPPRWGMGLGGGSAPSSENFCNSSFQMVHFHVIYRRYFHVERCVRTQA